MDRLKAMSELHQTIRQSLKITKNIEAVLEGARGRQLMFGLLLNLGLDYCTNGNNLSMEDSAHEADIDERQRFDYFTEV
jgi:hypothetical protein